KNAVIVMDDADLRLAVEVIVWRAFGTSAERCTACSRVIVHEDVQEDVDQMLVKEMEKLTIGNAIDEVKNVGLIINKAGIDKMKNYIAIGKNEGAKLLVGGHEMNEEELKDGYYFAPTLFTDVTPDMRIAQEEIFGPVVSLIPVKSFAEAIEVNNDVAYGL